MLNHCSQLIQVIQHTDEHRNKGTWQYDDIICLINSMQNHMDDLHHVKRKKHVFENVSNALLSNGYVATPDQCHVKWKSLLRSYKLCKENRNRTGKSPSKFNFFNQMDQILGEQPTNTCTRVLERSGDQVSLDREAEGENITCFPYNAGHLIFLSLKFKESLNLLSFSNTILFFPF